VSPGLRRAASHLLRKETIGGALLLTAAMVALVWANSPWAHRYEAWTGFPVGPRALHLAPSLATWAADGLRAAPDQVKVAVLPGSLTAAALAMIVPRLRNRTYRRLCEAEQVDPDRDTIPDVYQR
jgi:hypothetical protein